MSYTHADLAKESSNPVEYAEKHAIAKDQNWQLETTKYTFDDNSFLVDRNGWFCAVDADSAESLREYRSFIGTIDDIELEEIKRMIEAIEDEE